MPDQLPVDPIALLKQQIEKYEADQRLTGIDHAATLQSLRLILSQLEPPPAPISTRSGGVDVTAHTATIGGDVVGRDSITSQTATGGGVVLAGGTVHGGIHIGPPTTPALDDDTALIRYLTHVVEENRHLQLQGIRSTSGLVSIELEEIYITLTATERRTVTDERQWIDEMSQLAPGEAKRFEAQRPRGSVQQVKVKVQEALRAHTRLVVLGDPGCGKTTLLKYLALTFAHDRKSDAGLVEARLQLNETRLPILLPLRDFAMYLQKKHEAAGIDGPKLLLDFLNAYFANHDILLSKRFFADRLAQGECLVLLDGVDEVADLPTRQRIARIIEKFTIAYPKNRYVVTSRIVGYTEAARLSEEYAVTTVRDFIWDNITRFVTCWNRSIEMALAGRETPQTLFAAKQQTEALLKAIESNDRVRELAVNPLMLTVIALVHRYRAQLPERRAELYEEAIEVLLGHWDVAKGLSATRSIAGRELDAGDRRSLLEPIALWMMEQHAREIETDELRRQLSQRFQEMLKDEQEARKATDVFLHLINERSGLLTERGQGVYAFSHLTFQEHLAARAVSDKADYIEYTLKRLGDSWWREVVLLEAGYLSMQGKQRATALIQAIMDCPTEPEAYHNLVLAAECVRDVGQARITGDLSGEVQRRLQKEIETPLRKSNTREDKTKSIRRRAVAAEALGRIENGSGLQPAFWRLLYGEPVWVDVPTGKFIMGGDGQLVHGVHLPVFKIAKVPITNTQYRFFVEATQQSAPKHWSDGKVPRGLENHPVVYVSWRDALAYCRWLSQVTGKTITLPSEAQWEKAARGDLPPVTDGGDREGARAYPWGDAWDETKCNTGALELGETTPVGIFPEGISPYGCLDMAGNVWEWCHSRYRPYPYQATDGREDEAGDGARVLRGGAFDVNQYRARCAYRYKHHLDYRFDLIGFRVVVSSGFRF